jgi:hypothetical protein
VFSAVAVAFYCAFSEHRRHLLWLILGALVLILLSRSGTGLVGLLALQVWIGLSETQVSNRRRRVVVGTLLAVATVLALPQLLGRPDLFHTIGARFDKLWMVAGTGTPLELVIGRGLGVGSNLALTLSDTGLASAMAAQGQPIPWMVPSDSTLIALFIQTGLLGVATFYGLLAYAAARDPAARPFYLVVALCSLMHTLIELFPVNMLLGLVLARMLGGSTSILEQTRERPVQVEKRQTPAPFGSVASQHIVGRGKQDLTQARGPQLPVR